MCSELWEWEYEGKVLGGSTPLPTDSETPLGDTASTDTVPAGMAARRAGLGGGGGGRRRGGDGR